MAKRTVKLADSLGGTADISAKVRGAQDAMGDLGLNQISEVVKDTGQTRLGVKPEKPLKTTQLTLAPYTTSGTSLNPKVAFQQITAPNYGKAPNQGTSCGRCRAYAREDSLMGSCSKYDAHVRNDYTCDGWKSKKG